jgi:formate dehydrogenase subunit gamma
MAESATRASNGLIDRDRMLAIIAADAARPGATLPILHALQAEFGYVPDQAVPLIAEALNLSRAEIHGIVTFYHDFRHAPAGHHVLKLCRAEACQSMGSEALAADLLGRVGLAWGGTTADGELTVEPVYCLGLCACAPAALLDGAPLGRLNATVLAEAVAGEGA